MNEKTECVFYSMCVEKKKAWFVSRDDCFQGLYCINLSNGSIICLGRIPIGFRDSHALIGKVGNELIIAPRWEKSRFVKYDLQQNVFELVDLNVDLWNGNKSIAAFTNVVSIYDSLYFIGNNNGFVVEYNSVQKEFVIHSLKLPEGLSNEKLSFYWNSIRKYDENTWLLVPVSRDCILKYNLNSYSVQEIKTFSDIPFLSISMPAEDEILILPQRGNRLLLYNLKDEKKHIIDYPIKESLNLFKIAIKFKEGFLIVPDSLDDNFFFNIQTQELSRINIEFKGLNIDEKNKILALSYDEKSSQLYFLYSDGNLVTFNSDLSVETYALKLPNNRLDNLLKEDLLPCYEKIAFSLQDYLTLI